MKKEQEEMLLDVNTSQEEQNAADELKKLVESPAFHGFCGCKHGQKGEADILWNDSGHRTQIERGIWILAALEPGCEFLTMWAYKEFRDGFYEGLLDADYKDDWSNPGAFGKKYYISHFWDHKDNTNIYPHHVSLHVLGIRDTNFTAKDRIESTHARAATFHDMWKDKNETRLLRDAGYFLGVAAHFFTDLTQPMHAANCAEYLGTTQESVNFSDTRHSQYEKLADKILNDMSSADRHFLLGNAAKAVVTFADKLDGITLQTAQNARNIFHEDLLPGMNNRSRASAVPYADALKSYKRAFPDGQAAMARFLQQWVRQVSPHTTSKKLRSDWVSVSERKPVGEVAQPCMFYRRDGDLSIVFKYWNGSNWHEDAETFKGFRGGHTNSAKAFATCYDKGTTHAALFIAEESGRLFYFDAPNNAWQRTEIDLSNYGKAIGDITAIYDERTKKPSAFFRGNTGILHHVHWNGSKYAVHAFGDFPYVGGAISAAWDPTPAMGDNLGHVCVTYIGGENQIHHLRVRNSGWAHVAVTNTSGGEHPDPQMLATTYDPKSNGIAVFWGLVTYILKNTPADPDYQYMEQQPARLMYSNIALNGNVNLNEQIYQAASGRIGTTSKPNVSVHFFSAGYATDARVSLERKDGTWVRQVFTDDTAPGMISATDSVTNSIIVGCRTSKRTASIHNYKA
jgi:hypothetical protein